MADESVVREQVTEELEARQAFYAEQARRSRVAGIVIGDMFMPAVLQHGLALPEGMEIVGLHGPDPARRGWWVTVRSDQFPVVEEGDEMPQLQVIYHTREGRRVRVEVTGEFGSYSNEVVEDGE